jgi:hypothetical protein
MIRAMSNALWVIDTWEKYLVVDTPPYVHLCRPPYTIYNQSTNCD